jgi:cell wall-associated NlpC family hydrolase/nucleoid-associated protein YgaU
MPRHAAWRWAARAAIAASVLAAPVAVQADQLATTTHVVAPGETLSQIALSLGVDTAALVSMNGLDDANFVFAGQSLKVPDAAAASPPTAAARTGAATTTKPAASPTPTAPTTTTATTYTVVDGDTLWGIAKQMGTTLDALVQANHLDDPDHLALGTQLRMPGASSDPAPAARAASAAPPTTTTIAGKRGVQVSYTVQPGETLGQIAHQFGVASDTIAQANGLDDPNRLAAGAVLKVPVPAKEHQVAEGETLRDIALQEKVDLGALVDFNQLDDPELIRAGQTLLVPVPATSAKAAPGLSAATATPQPTQAASPPAASQPAATQAGQPAAAQPAKQATVQGPNKPAAPVAVLAPPRGAPTDGLVGTALKLLGSPYVWGGSSPSGFDCSGFIWYVSRQVGKPLSRGMYGEYNSGSHPARDELKPGDLVFFQNTYTPGLSHNGIYIGNGQFVSAVNEGTGVTISNLGTPYWSSHWFGATRLP